MRLLAVGAAAVLAKWQIGDLAAGVVLTGATLGTLWTGGKVLARLVRLADMLSDLPEWMLATDKRLKKGSEDFTEIRSELADLKQSAATAANHSAAVARDLDIHSRGEAARAAATDLSDT